MFSEILFFIFGTFIGSFLNVVIFRFPKLDGILFGRSECPKCKKEISFYNLIPILSWIFLAGKCQNCKKNISIQYPIVEFATGMVFLLFSRFFNLDYQLLTYLIIFSLAILIFVYDMKYLQIPEIFSWLLLIFCIIGAFFAPDFLVSSFLLGGLVGGGILGILVGISDEKFMGAGDIKIGLAFGFLLGFPRSILFIFLSFVTGALIGVVLILLKSKKMKSEIAFAPFLILSALISVFYGQAIINLYLKFAMI